MSWLFFFFFVFQAEDGIRDYKVTGVQTCALPIYLMQVLDAKGRTWLDPILKPLERVTYRVMGTHPDQEQDWKQYAVAMLLFSLVSCLFTYVILRVQQLLPLNPQDDVGEKATHQAEEQH